MTEPQQDSSELENSEQSADGPEKSSGVIEQGKASKSGNRKNKPRGRNNHSDRTSGKRPNAGSSYSRDSKGFKLSSDGLVRHFLGCRICCYFLAGVQVIYGRDVVDRMVQEFDGKWLTVPLSYEVRKLMQQTYGVRLDQNLESVDFACEVCTRRFVIDLPIVELVEENESPVAKPEGNESEQDRVEVEPEAIPAKRSIEENVREWDEGNLPMMKVEFKHRR